MLAYNILYVSLIFIAKTSQMLIYLYDRNNKPILFLFALWNYRHCGDY